MERYLAKGMPLLSSAQNPLNFEQFTNYDAYASSVGEDRNKISLPDMETSNKDAGDLQEDEEIPGINDDHGMIFVATGHHPQRPATHQNTSAPSPLTPGSSAYPQGQQIPAPTYPISTQLGGPLLTPITPWWPIPPPPPPATATADPHPPGWKRCTMHARIRKRCDCIDGKTDPILAARPTKRKPVKKFT